jgi:hypothetical protein
MRLLLTTVVPVAFLAACSNAPGEGDAREVFESRLRREVGTAPLQIESFRKVDGQDVEMFGVEGYRFFYAARVSFPEGYRPECVKGAGRFPGFDCWFGFAGRGGTRPQLPGASVDYKGEISFEKRENGWVPVG